MVKRGTWLLLVAALFVSCPDFHEGRQTFRELLALRDQIAKEFGEQVVDVSIASDDRMTVKFTNSPFRLRSREEKQARADAVFAYVAQHYKQPLSSVAIQFGGETYVGRPAPNPDS